METVEMRDAFEWTCPECGRDNFERAIMLELAPDDVRKLIEEHGGDADGYRTGYWQSFPEGVICPYCKTEFKTEAPDGFKRT